MNLGVLSLLPIIVLLVLVFTTRRTLLALTAASLVGAILIGGINFPAVWIEKIQLAFMGGTVGYLFMLLALFGILIRLLIVSDYALYFAHWLGKFANSRKKALLLTYLLGWIICVDDYLNNMAVAASMKRICDRHKVPRTLFGFVVNCTAAPVCVLIPISTWAVFYSGLFEDYGIVVNGSGFGAYLAGIPYLFYAWISLIICLLVIFGVFPLLGISKKDDQYAKGTGIVCTAERSADEKEIKADPESPGSQEKANPIFFLIPMIVITALTIITNDVLVGCLGAIFVTALMLLVSRKLSIWKIFDAAFEGIAGNVQVCCVIAVALGLVEINKATGLAEFIVAVITPVFENASFTFPALVFAFCAAYTFSAGGFWDGSMLFMPIVVPIAKALGIDPLLSCMALVCAATAGSTTYVAGDAVLIASRAVDIKPIYQTKATLPYALVSYFLTIAAFLIAGFIQQM
ncbi:MAG: TRAP transporter large permease subunit [Clostridiales bacterium]|nr:TRAP transporter large permease subunit [Clostridiales bacterium]